ncbi:hypothetical protein J4P02_02940 [Pseudomonas sp. NFXW11]|uniref:hypothetical protein n=1 Tax=Pseudomonas sp. NFXW11 TaxID=2819531 RepID=UPI003CECECCC
MLKWWWKDRWERKLFYGFLASFTFLLMVKIKFPVPTFMASPNWAYLISALQSKAFEDIVGDLMTGIAAAYIFYIFIEIFPRHHREKNSLRALNYILASVVDSYVNIRTFGHEDLISHNDLALLESQSTKKLIDELQRKRERRKFSVQDFARLRVMLGCVNSRIQDIRLALPIAASLSPEHALQWLQLSDRARLIHEQFGKEPVGMDGCFEPEHVFGTPSKGMNDSNDLYVAYRQGLTFYADGLAQRLVQFVTEIEAWIKLPVESDINRHEIPSAS